MLNSKLNTLLSQQMNLSSSVLDLITTTLCFTQQELLSGKATPI